MYGLPFVLLHRLHRYAIDARRRSRSGRYYAWAALAAVCASVLIAAGAAAAVVLWRVGLWWMSVIAVGLMVLPHVAGVLLRHAVVPLGWVRPAFYLAYFDKPGADGEAYALCCAAWAFASRPSPRGEAWIDRRRAARVPLGDAEVVATALIVAGRGDADAARILLRSTLLLIESHPAVRELAGEWLAADAAERGAWAELADDAAAARWPASPLTLLLEGVAAQRVAAVGTPGRPGRHELFARWLMAPHRGVTRGLLAAPPPPPAPPPTLVPVSSAGELVVAAGDPPSGPPPLPRAIASYLEVRRRPPGTRELDTAVRAWDAALADGATHGWLARRALELDAPLGAVDRALRELAAQVTEELAALADAHQLATPASHGPVGDGVARRLRHGRLDALEQGFTRWAQRRHDGAARAAIDEWREFIALQAAYAAAVTAGGGELRRLAFPHAFSTGTNMSAWLWNARHEYALSHAISRWLLAEALAVGDTEAIELGHRNCGLTVPTRLGQITERPKPRPA